MEILEKEWRENMSFDDAMVLSLKALKLGLDEKDKLDYRRVEFAYIDSSRTYKGIPNEKIKAYMPKI